MKRQQPRSRERRNPVLDLVRNVRGTAPYIAKACGIHREAVWNWQRVPAEHVVTLELLLKIPRHQIRPDLYPYPSPPDDLTKRWKQRLNSNNGRKQHGAA